MHILTVSVLLTAIAFLYYGMACLVSPHLKEEFERFGLPGYRILTGTLQLLGSAGIAVGLIFPTIGFLAAAGLTLLMLAGFIVRVKIKDELLQALPSFILMCINGYIAKAFYHLM